MFKYRNKAIVFGIVLLTMSILIVSVPPAQAQFIIASWDFPDEYGQGIEAIEVYENSTGSWVLDETYFYSDDTSDITWNESVAIKLYCWTWFNSSLVGVSTTNEGKLYQRHSVVVTTVDMFVAGIHTVFSQQNFTYQYSDSGIDPPLWYYGYMVVLDFLPLGGTIYTVTVTYEIFY